MRGRFPLVDALQPNAGGTAGYNAYADANGKPVTLVDPGGTRPWDAHRRDRNGAGVPKCRLHDL